MKKVLSLVLVLTLVLGSFGFAFADTTATTTTTPTDVVGTDFESAVTALSALGVVSGYEDGTYKPANIVTRAEMAKLIIAELGLTANATGAKSTFKDMAGYGWAEGYIGYAQSLGIINGYGDGTFKPGKTVSYDEALTMIVSALGYTKACKEMNGSWPAIYVQKARVLGITDDVKAGGAVGANRGDIAMYLYNMLTANMGYADADGVYVEKKDKDGDKIKVITNLDAEESDDYAVITKSDADNAVVNIRPYVGAYAKVFILNKGKNDGDIIAISDCKSEFVTGEYNADDSVIETADGTEYKLDDIDAKGVDGTSKEDIDKAFEFVNGDTAAKGSTILNDDQETLDKDKDGAIVTVAADLSGKTIKGIFSVQLWKANSDDKVDADDLTSIKNNKTLLGQDFALDDDDNIDYESFELVGVNSLSDIKADNIVYVYVNNDDEISRVAVGTEVAEGEITAIKEGSTNKVTIDGKVYLFTDEKLKGFNGVSADFDVNDIETGDEIKAFLDAYGYMYDYDSISGKADNYAVVLELGTKTTGKISDTNQIKLFLADGTDKIFDVDDDLFDGGKDSVVGVTTKDAWTTTVGAIVKYGVDKDGVIDTFEDLTDDDYTTVIDQRDSSTKIDITEKGYYDNTQIRSNAVIFTFEGAYGDDTDKTDEDNYSVTTLEKVLDTSDVDATYITDNEKISAMLMYDYTGSDAIYGVVTGTKKISGDSDYQATLYVGKDEKTYGLASEGVYTEARKGADFDAKANEKVYKLEFNANGEIKDLTPAWTDSEDTYATKAAVVSAGDKPAYKNNTFRIPEQGLKVNIEGDAVVYKNDDGDFKLSNLNDLDSLNANAKVWFFDTTDDNNDGLMNIVLIDNPDKADKPTGSSAMGTIDVEDTTLNEIVVDGNAYTIVNTSLLKDENGTTVAAGIDQIQTALAVGDKVQSVTLDSKNKVATIKILRDEVATLISADADAVDALIDGIADATPELAKVKAARAAYDKLGTEAKKAVTSAKYTELQKYEALYDELAKITTAAMNAGAITNTTDTVAVAQALVDGTFTVAYVSSSDATGTAAVDASGVFTVGAKGDAITLVYSVAKDGATVTMAEGVVVTID